MPSRPYVMPRAGLRVAEWLEQGLGADPGLLRLRFAARVTLLVALAALGLIALHRWAAMPVPAAALGFMVAQFSGAAVRDPTPRAQAVTTLLIGLPALAGAALASVVAPWRWATDLGFLLVVFAAALARGRGLRLAACGMQGFVGFYIAQLLQLQPEQLPYGAGAVGFVILTALLVRLVLFPERPAAALPRLVRSVERQAAHLLDEVRRSPPAGEPRRLIRRRARLQEAILAAEEQIERLHGAGEGGMSRLTMQLLELQLGAQRVALLCTDPAREGQAGPALLHRLDRIIRQLGLSPGGGEPAARQEARDHTPLGHALERLSATVRDLPRAPGAILTAARERLPLGEAEKPAAADASQGGGVEVGWLGPGGRQVIQVTVASGAAMLLGQLLSSQRWYWSVLAAFIIFAGTGPRTATLTKALQRILGTLLGIGAGLAIGAAVQGNQGLILLLALLCEFLAFYAFQAAYAVMIFWITVMLSLLYALLGHFQAGLLEIRLGETVIGAAAGMAVAAALLPRRTRDALREAGLGFLRALCAVLGSRPWEAPHPEAAAHSQAGPVRRCVQTLRAAAGPLDRGWAVATPPAMRETVQAAMACAYLLDEWLALCRRGAPQSGDVAALRADLERIIEAIECGAPLPAGGGTAGAPGGEGTALAALTQAIHHFAAALDAALRRGRLGAGLAAFWPFRSAGTRPAG
ncbi:FUSC family protein [Roseomonas sp. E05]|uniref:FUSC family protein n=1 Tax=Roseomonas sp. E05 TaxID=3046310 RepID=UPI0024BB4187|nr:FUSC family protein [Roseomonas sp. E05]MDJ0389311.1 FUSC family protein [Roseomonas sp. E05]